MGQGTYSLGDSSAPPFGLQLSAGVDLTLVKPRFVRNDAFTTLQSDGASQESTTVSDFEYDTELAPRVWLLLDAANGLGFRAQYWQFDHAPGALSTSPPANGFGQITHPGFGDVDIGSTIPTDQFQAASALNAYSIDLEATKALNHCDWGVTFGGGIRFASIEQSYFAELRNRANELRGQIDYEHSTDGIGPTVSALVRRQLGNWFHIYSRARGSVLFGDTMANLAAIEDADLVNSFNSQHTESRDGFLPIGELQVGLETQTPLRGCQRAFARVGFEGQVWGNVGNASQLEGDVGFVGFHVGFGFIR